MKQPFSKAYEQLQDKLRADFKTWFRAYIEEEMALEERWMTFKKRPSKKQRPRNRPRPKMTQSV